MKPKTKHHLVLVFGGSTTVRQKILRLIAPSKEINKNAHYFESGLELPHIDFELMSILTDKDGYYALLPLKSLAFARGEFEAADAIASYHGTRKKRKSGS